jgi:Predicted amidohydrolase
MTKRFTAACIQMCSARDPQNNRDSAVALVREALSRGADYIQTPEMTNIVNRDRDCFRESVTGENEDIVLAALREIAREGNAFIHIGSLALLDGDRYVNRAFIIDRNGDVVARYDKIHLFDVDLPNGESWRESASYRAGDRAVLTDLPWGLLGISICYDARFPHLYRSLAKDGASFLSAPACFTRQTGEAHWHVLQRARAIENGAYMISAAQSGHHEDGRETYGHSVIIDPWGRVLTDAGDGPGVICAEIDPELVTQVRQRIPSLLHDRPYSMDR